MIRGVIMTIDENTTKDMPNALKKNEEYNEPVVVREGAITVSADGTKHLDIVKFLGTQAGRARLNEIMPKTKVPQED